MIFDNEEDEPNIIDVCDNNTVSDTEFTNDYFIPKENAYTTEK